MKRKQLKKKVSEQQKLLTKKLNLQSLKADFLKIVVKVRLGPILQVVFFILKKRVKNENLKIRKRQVKILRKQKLKVT